MTDVIYGHVQRWKHAGIGEWIGLRLLSSAIPPFSPVEKYHGLVIARLLVLASGAHIPGAVNSCNIYFEDIAPGSIQLGADRSCLLLATPSPLKVSSLPVGGEKSKKMKSWGRKPSGDPKRAGILGHPLLPVISNPSVPFFPTLDAASRAYSRGWRGAAMRNPAAER